MPGEEQLHHPTCQPTFVPSRREAPASGQVTICLWVGEAGQGVDRLSTSQSFLEATCRARPLLAVEQPPPAYSAESARFSKLTFNALNLYYLDELPWR